MQNTSHLLLTETETALGAGDAPRVFKLRQQFARPVEEDVAGATRREVMPLVEGVSSGQSIAITGSSRGIANLATVIKECVAAVKARGGIPFVVPGMGSHGGATADGQRAVLADTNGITEQSVGCEIRASMAVVQVGTTESGFPVFQDKLCHEADGVLVINRVKPHTGFTEVVESGLCKMLVIGLGKQTGASKIHQQALRMHMGQLVLDASKIIVECDRPRLLGGIAVVENAFKETAIVKGIAMPSHQALVDAEAELLVKAYELLPRLPFADLDALIVDEIGKNISGAGMDTNVIGKKPGLSSPRIGAIYIRGLSEETHGNGVGIGNADLMPRRLVEQIDLNSTYMNAVTAKRLAIGKIPMLADTELQALQILQSFRQTESADSLRLAWIRNTSKLDELWATESLLDEVRADAHLEVVCDPQQLKFDEGLQFVAPAP